MSLPDNPYYRGELDYHSTAEVDHKTKTTVLVQFAELISLAPGFSQGKGSPNSSLNRFNGLRTGNR